jgi:hypothetical protein
LSTLSASTNNLTNNDATGNKTAKPFRNVSLLGRLLPFNFTSSGHSAVNNKKSPEASSSPKHILLQLSFSNVASSASIISVDITPQDFSSQQPFKFKPSAEEDNITVEAFIPKQATNNTMTSRNDKSNSSSLQLDKGNESSSIKNEWSSATGAPAMMWTSMRNIPIDSAIWEIQGLSEPAPAVGCYSLRLTDTWGRQLYIR